MMSNKSIAVLGCVGIAVGTLAGLPARAEEAALVQRQIEVEAQFTELDGGITNVLSAPKVATVLGQDATIKVVTEWSCPNGEVVEEGVILCVTPTIEEDTLVIKGSAHVVKAIQPNKNKAEKTVEWIGFKELKAYYKVSAKDPHERYRLGPVEVDKKKVDIWISARLVAE